MIRLSIILPTFNVEKYIERCIRSLEDQNLSSDEYEVIIINDGSTDRSQEIAKSLQAEYSNIKIKDQLNSGVASAINSGIKLAKGEYFIICGPDDYVEKNTLGEMLNVTKRSNLDGCCFNMKHTTLNGTRIIDNYPFKETDVMDGITFFERGYLHGYTVTWIINRQFILQNELLFIEVRSFATDLEFLIRFACLAKRVKYYNLASYNYVVRKGSIAMTSRRKENILNSFPFIENLGKFKEKIIKDERSLNFIEERIASYYQDLINFVTYPKFIKYFPVVRNEIKRKGQMEFNIKKFKSRRKNELALMNRSITLYFIYALIKVNSSLLITKLGMIVNSKKVLNFS